MKKYRLYAGYYELHIARHELPAPFVPISGHNKIGRAVEAARRFDSDAQIIAYPDSVEALAEALGVDEETLIVA